MVSTQFAPVCHPVDDQGDPVDRPPWKIHDHPSTTPREVLDRRWEVLAEVLALLLALIAEDLPRSNPRGCDLRPRTSRGVVED